MVAPFNKFYTAKFELDFCPNDTHRENILLLTFFICLHSQLPKFYTSIIGCSFQQFLWQNLGRFLHTSADLKISLYVCVDIIKIQFTVSHTNTSVFNIQFSKLYLHLLALFLTKDCLLYKEVGLVLRIYAIAIVKFSNRSIQNIFNFDK